MESGKAAILGLGIIGSRVCQRLLDAGVAVSCWSRSPRGIAGECASPELAVSDAKWISIYLKDAVAVREVFSRISGSLVPGQIVLNHATIDLPTTLWLGKQCSERGLGFIDAPFTGSRDAAAAGNLVYYLGGDSALAEDADSYLALSSRLRLHCGEVGSATVVKLATNLISACTVQAMSEASAIATSHGVSMGQLAAAVAENASGSALSAMKFKTMMEGDFSAHFSLDNMAKDSRYMLALANQAGLKTPAIEAVSARMHELCDQGHADMDYAVLAKPYLDPA
ncbi:MAG: NAD(P)-dependent oxidoreductase [Luteolibacter sp.]